MTSPHPHQHQHLIISSHTGLHIPIIVTSSSSDSYPDTISTNNTASSSSSPSLHNLYHKYHLDSLPEVASSLSFREYLLQYLEDMLCADDMEGQQQQHDINNQELILLWGGINQSDATMSPSHQNGSNSSSLPHHQHQHHDGDNNNNNSNIGPTTTTSTTTSPKCHNDGTINGSSSPNNHHHQTGTLMPKIGTILDNKTPNHVWRRICQSQPHGSISAPFKIFLYWRNVSDGCSLNATTTKAPTNLIRFLVEASSPSATEHQQQKPPDASQRQNLSQSLHTLHCHLSLYKSAIQDKFQQAKVKYQTVCQSLKQESLASVRSYVKKLREVKVPGKLLQNATTATNNATTTQDEPGTAASSPSQNSSTTTSHQTARLSDFFSKEDLQTDDWCQAAFNVMNSMDKKLSDSQVELPEDSQKWDQLKRQLLGSGEEDESPMSLAEYQSQFSELMSQLRDTFAILNKHRSLCALLSVAVKKIEKPLEFIHFLRDFPQLYQFLLLEYYRRSLGMSHLSKLVHSITNQLQIAFTQEQEHRNFFLNMLKSSNRFPMERLVYRMMPQLAQSLPEYSTLSQQMNSFMEFEQFSKKFIQKQVDLEELASKLSLQQPITPMFLETNYIQAEHEQDNNGFLFMSNHSRPDTHSLFTSDFSLSSSSIIADSDSAKNDMELLDRELEELKEHISPEELPRLQKIESLITRDRRQRREEKANTEFVMKTLNELWGNAKNLSSGNHNLDKSAEQSSELDDVSSEKQGESEEPMDFSEPGEMSKSVEQQTEAASFSLTKSAEQQTENHEVNELKNCLQKLNQLVEKVSSHFPSEKWQDEQSSTQDDAQIFDSLLSHVQTQIEEIAHAKRVINDSYMEMEPLYLDTLKERASLQHKLKYANSTNADLQNDLLQAQTELEHVKDQVVALTKKLEDEHLTVHNLLTENRDNEQLIMEHVQQKSSLRTLLLTCAAFFREQLDSILVQMKSDNALYSLLSQSHSEWKEICDALEQCKGDDFSGVERLLLQSHSGSSQNSREANV